MKMRVLDLRKLDTIVTANLELDGVAITVPFECVYLPEGVRGLKILDSEFQKKMLTEYGNFNRSLTQVFWGYVDGKETIFPVVLKET